VFQGGRWARPKSYLHANTVIHFYRHIGKQCVVFFLCTLIRKKHLVVIELKYYFYAVTTSNNIFIALS
jgi:hypothetical protein